MRALKSVGGARHPLLCREDGYHAKAVRMAVCGSSFSVSNCGSARTVLAASASSDMDANAAFKIKRIRQGERGQVAFQIRKACGELLISVTCHEKGSTKRIQPGRSFNNFSHAECAVRLLFSLAVAGADKTQLAEAKAAFLMRHDYCLDSSVYKMVPVKGPVS